MWNQRYQRCLGIKGKLALTAVAFFGLVMLSSAGDTAKKLVGVWEATKVNGKEYKGKLIFEFMADRKFSETSGGFKWKGKYDVDGDVIKFFYDEPKFGESRFSRELKELTDTKLQWQLPMTANVFEFKRVKK